MSAAKLAQLAVRVLRTPPAASRGPAVGRAVGNFGDDMFSSMMKEVSRDAGPWGAIVTVPASLAKGAIDAANHHDPDEDTKKRAAAEQKKQAAEAQKARAADEQRKRAAEHRKRAEEARRAEARRQEAEQKREQDAKRLAEEAKRTQDHQRLVYVGVGVGGVVTLATIAAIVRRR